MSRTRWIPALLLIAAATGYGQTKNPVSSALREILPGRQKNTVAAVEEMPADKFGYKPTADQMTFGHLVTHVIESNNLIVQQGSSCPGAEGGRGEGVRRQGQASRFVESVLRFLLRRPFQNGRFETRRDDRRLRRATGLTSADRARLGWKLGGSLRNGGDIFASQWPHAAVCKEVAACVGRAPPLHHRRGDLPTNDSISSSPITATPSSRALSSFDPASLPATT